MTRPRLAQVHPEKDGVVVIDLLRDLDYSCAREVKNILLEQLAPQQVRGVVVNMTDVRYMDSSGLEAIASSQIRAKAQSISFCVANPSGPVRRVLQVTGLERFITIHDSLEAALTALGTA